ncbi:hypothetical protein T265_14613, partial [Opisthorchis viverrini]
MPKGRHLLCLEASDFCIPPYPAHFTGSHSGWDQDAGLSDELAANGVTAEEVIELIIKRIVKYYEKLEKDVFCKIR